MEEEALKKSRLEDSPGYRELERQIVERWGRPSFCNGRAVNLPAQKVFELKQCFMKQKRYRQSNKKLMETVEDMIEKNGEALPAVVDLPPQILVPFQIKDQKIIQAYFNHPFGDAKTVAQEAGENEEYVRGFLNSKEFLMAREAICKAFKESLPFEAWLAIQRCLRSRNVDNTVLNAAKSILEEVGQLRSKADTEINIFQTSIDDPVAIEALRQLGDRLANQSNVIPADDIPS